MIGRHRSYHDTEQFNRQAFLNMNPGATIEYQSSTWEICSDDGTAEGTNLERWLQLLTAGAKAMGRDALSCLRVEQWLKELGFVDVHRVEVLLPSKTNASRSVPWSTQSSMSVF